MSPLASRPVRAVRAASRRAPIAARRPRLVAHVVARLVASRLPHRLARAAAGAATLAVLAAPAGAQHEGALRAAFEGRTVTLRIDMPATSQGVDVWADDAQMPVNFRDVAQRLKDNGTAIRMGQQAMVTKVVVKKSHVEFQLGGGGYGTFTDWATNGSAVSAVGVGETSHERTLREAIDRAGGDERKRLERELAASRAARQRENGRAAAEAQQANQAREANLRTKRLEAGSRFNLRYRHGFPPEGLTADGVARLLARYVDVGDASLAPGAGAPAALATAVAPTGTPTAPAATRAAAVPPAGGIGALRKGLSLAEVETLLGPAATAAERRDGSLSVARRTYRPDGAQVSARFVGGVLVDYAITPR